jgi:hypothetical protein
MNLIVNNQAFAMGNAGGKYELKRDASLTYQVEASATGYATQRIDLSFTGEPTQTVKVVLPPDGGTVAVAPPKPVEPATPTVAPTPTATPPPDKPKPPKPTTTPDKPKPPKPAVPDKPKPEPVGKTATLKIGVDLGSKPAKVSVDGKPVGTTPIGNHKVTPGKHKIKWTWDDGRESTRTVDIGDGETKIEKAK